MTVMKTTPASAPPSPAPAPAEPPEHSLVPPHLADSIDRLAHASLARMTRGLSPAVLMLAYLDWAVHLGWSPGKQLRLADKAQRKLLKLTQYLTQCATGQSPKACIAPMPHDRRFDAEPWSHWPYNLLQQSFLLSQQWWHNATTDIRGVEPHHLNMVYFCARQVLDMLSPTNSLLTNPELQLATARAGGQNLVQGAVNWIQDLQALAFGDRPNGRPRMRPGRELARTPGSVVYRNDLMELIQYDPADGTVQAEPLLVVPAWIMKYYVLDLQPHNSLIKYLVDAGFTVFAISWKNPGREDRDYGLSDYRRMGVLDALEVISEIVPGRRVHGVGYCLGGTLLAITAAAMARDGDERLASLSLLATQVDFSEAGELMTFIDEDQVSFLEDMMWEQGYLDTTQMAGAFDLLRPHDLIWSRMVREYLLGDRPELTDLMSWNADQTRMPYKMHSQYLRRLFLGNALALGHYRVDGRTVSLTDIRVPICAIATEKDHIAPWRSVYKLHLLTDNRELAFILTSGGHNGGIVSEPGHPRRHYRMGVRRDDQRYVDPETWLASTTPHDGSWWPAWTAWLEGHCSGTMPAPQTGSDRHPLLGAAPGAYVLQP